MKEQTFNRFELIVVDDNSEDNTSRLSSEYGARVIKAEKLPLNWTGKTWACYSGAIRAKGSVLVFLDADTRLTKNGLSSILNEFFSYYNAGVLSVQPYHTVQKLYENLSVIFNMVVMISMGCFTLLGNKLTPVGIFGPCMVIKKDLYLKIAKNEDIRTSVLEDIEIARKLKRNCLLVVCRKILYHFACTRMVLNH